MKREVVCVFATGGVVVELEFLIPAKEFSRACEFWRIGGKILL